MIPELWLFAVFSHGTPGCEASLYTLPLDTSSLLSTIIDEAWHHLAQGIKTIMLFLSIVVVVFSPQNCSPIPIKKTSLVCLWGYTQPQSISSS